jgi:hypothetical protein
VRLDELDRELGCVGITGARRERILAEAADHLADGDTEAFGDPRAIAQAFADELATAGATRSAFRAFAALAVAGLGFAAAWLLVPAAGGWTYLGAAPQPALAIAAAFGMIFCSQVALAAELLAGLQAWRLRGERAAPAAEVALLLRRTVTALAFGAAAMLAVSLFALESRGQLDRWYVVGAGIGGLALTVPLVAVAATLVALARLRPVTPGAAGDVFDDLPLQLPRRPWLLCLGLAAFAVAVTFAGGGLDEGPRNAVVETILVLGGFAILGRGLGLRPQRRS